VRVQVRRLVSRPVLVAAAAGTGSLLGAAGGSGAAAAYLARKVITPPELQPDDVAILRHDDESVTFAAAPDPVVPGRYGVWLDGGAGHARVGDILESDATSVTRRLLSVDRGALSVGPARWNQYYFWDRPSVSLGLPDEDVSIVSDVGALPGWVVRPANRGSSSDWAVLVHGRGARKEETLRAVPVLREAGWTSLVAAYRNDRDAPLGPDGRYNLGLSEWRDVEAAMGYAVSHGARRILLLGWSMGGAIVLQTLDHSPLSEYVVGVVLDSAVIDWGVVLRHHGRLRRVPAPLVRMASGLLGSRRSRRLVGVREPIDVARTDWVARADELRHPMLVIASDGDDFVPIGPAVALAGRRPDLVRFERWDVARHCREWNYDPERWERVLREFVTSG
jgi:alpha-beta hydrolase superfamily lysophospholipase